MAALLKDFEANIEPLISKGHKREIDSFKGVVRDKINGLAYEGKRAARALPGEAVSRQTADLAERLAFPPNTED